MPDKKILIVDDEPDMRLAIKNVLKIRGYDSIEAGDGKTAVELVEKEKPAMVLLDIRLPGMDGVEALERIRKINKTIPVVMITGYGHIQNAVDVMKLGAQEYLQKPFENKQLVEIVKKFTELKPEEEPEKFISPKGKAVEYRKTKSMLIWLFAIIGILILLFKFYLDRINYMKVYPLGFKEISALAISGNRVFVGDWIEQKIAEYEFKNGLLNFVNEYSLKDVHITAFTVAYDKLYLSDSWKQTIEVRALNEHLSLIKVYKNIGKIVSMSFDGKNLWLKDDENNIYVRSLDPDFTLLKSYQILESDEIFTDKKYLWAMVFKDGRVYKYKKNGELEESKVYFIRSDGKEFSAFTMQNGKIYYTLVDENKLVEVNKEFLRVAY